MADMQVPRTVGTIAAVPLAQPDLTISLVTAVFNRASTVGHAIACVQSQSWRQVQHVVIDGASTDGTVDILKACLDDRAVWVSEPDRGIYDALNKGLARATGDVVGLMHSDDFFAHDEVLARVAQAFADPAVDAVYGDLQYVSQMDTSRVIRHWRAGDYQRAQLRWGWMPPHPTLFLRRRVIEQWGGYDTRYRIAADYDAMLRYLWQGGIKAVYLPEVLVKMRVGGESNRSLRLILRKSYEDRLILRRNGVGGLGALVWKNLSKLSQFWQRA